MKSFIAAVDRTNRRLGKAVSWCAIAMMMLQAMAVIARYVFSYGLIGFQEAVVYCHSLLFLLGAAYVLQCNEHVRVDIFYAMMTERGRRLVDLLGLLLFVIPVALVVLWVGLPYAVRAWATLEGSRQAGGLPAIYLLKSAIIVFAASTGLQAAAIAARILMAHQDRHWIPEEHQTGSPNGA